MPTQKYQTQRKSSQQKASSLPRSWPAEIRYLHKPAYSSGITPELSKTLHKMPSQSTINQNAASSTCPSRLVHITPITDPAHPASGQYGLFASQNLEANSFILFYLGLVHAQSEADPTSDYDLSLDRELGVGIDSAQMGNEARYINDYRGVGAAPNADFREVWVSTENGGCEKRMGVFVLPAGKSGKRAKGIRKGEEILVSYGKGFWREREAEQGEFHGEGSSTKE